MNLLQQAREQCEINLDWCATFQGVRKEHLQAIESLPTAKLTYAHFELYSRILSTPIGALFDEHCDLPLRRGAVIRAYRNLLSLAKLLNDDEQKNQLLLVRRALEQAIPELKHTRLQAYPKLSPDYDKVGRVVEQPVDGSYYGNFIEHSELKDVV